MRGQKRDALGRLFFILCWVRSLGGLGSLDGLDQLGNDLEQVAHDTVVSHLEDGSGIVLVHGDDALGILHAGLVLDGAGDAQCDVDLGMDGLAGLANLMVGREPAVVYYRAAAADNAAEFVSLAIQNTPAGQDTRFGVWFEPLLPRLCPPRDF